MQADIEVRSEEPTKDRTDRHALQAWVNACIKAEILDLSLNIGYTDGLAMDQLMCLKGEEGWMFIVKAHKRGHRKAAFVTAETFGEGLELVGSFGYQGCLPWRTDKKPPKAP